MYSFMYKHTYWNQSHIPFNAFSSFLLFSVFSPFFFLLSCSPFHHLPHLFSHPIFFSSILYLTKRNKWEISNFGMYGPLDWFSDPLTDHYLHQSYGYLVGTQDPPWYDGCHPLQAHFSPLLFFPVNAIKMQTYLWFLHHTNFAFICAFLTTWISLPFSHLPLAVHPDLQNI